MKSSTLKIIIYVSIAIIVVALEIYIWQLAHPNSGTTTQPVIQTVNQ